MFLASVCPSSGVLGCIYTFRASILPSSGVLGCIQPNTPYRCPKHVELFIIINKLLHQVGPLVIFMYDARTHIHQSLYIFLKDSSHATVVRITIDRLT